MEGSHGSPIRLLVVNERKEIVESIAHFLSGFSHVRIVGTAHGLPDSIACARETRPSTVLCDYSKLKRETLERIKQLRAVLPQACIIAMSYDEEESDEAVQAGADQFISKFDVNNQLLPALEQCASSVK
jgi:DNA-binding NarL/FixJ family response regulator